MTKFWKRDLYFGLFLCLLRLISACAMANWQRKGKRQTSLCFVLFEINKRYGANRSLSVLSTQTKWVEMCNVWMSMSDYIYEMMLSVGIFWSRHLFLIVLEWIFLGNFYRSKTRPDKNLGPYNNRPQSHG